MLGGIHTSANQSNTNTTANPSIIDKIATIDVCAIVGVLAVAIVAWHILPGELAVNATWAGLSFLGAVFTIGAIADRYFNAKADISGVTVTNVPTATTGSTVAVPNIPVTITYTPATAATVTTPEVKA